MTDNTNNKWKTMTDMTIIKSMGAFIKNHRLEQNKTQAQLAEEAGVNRSTLGDIEQGKPSNILSIIQILRALNLLHLLQIFQLQEQFSPIQLAKLDEAKRKRASKTQISKTKSDW